MKTKLFFFFLLCACTIQAQTTHLLAGSFRWKPDFQSWQKDYCNFGIEWNYPQNKIEVNNDLDQHFELIFVSHTKPQKPETMIDQYKYTCMDYDSLKMWVIIEKYPDHRVNVMMIHKRYRVQYFCKEVLKPFKK